MSGASLPEGALAFLELMRRRYACKRFDGRPLEPGLEDYLLECGRLSPSSFGLEPWLFRSVSDRARIGGPLYEACFRQEAVGSASLVVAILVRRAQAYDPDGDFVASRAGRFPGGHPVFRADYIGYYGFLAGEGRLEAWSRAQAYLACANMLSGAAAAGLDSCPIEGFDEAALLAALGEDGGQWLVGLVAAFGRGDEERREKIRESLSSIARRG
ncbi:MAG TPA: nitroreductase family protein [Spirochaetales bacterium]|nr:nitroreductase family protein [Spirochaetales bacterium]HRY56131.1 nitroreductase family protein [Spirochaetia bacterium]HRZ66458.1 nitroreductase family protein [Spirochaetia bacterium]